MPAPMWLGVALLLGAGHGPSPEPPDLVARMLLEDAAQALGRGSLPETEALLRRWASLGPHPPPAGPLEAMARDAQTWADRVGRLDVFASRLSDRIRVGLHDPAGLVIRVRAFRGGPLSSVPLVQQEGERPDRLEFAVGERLGPDETIVVEVLTRHRARDWAVARLALPVGTEAPPEAPLQKLEAPLGSGAPASDGTGAEWAPDHPWWWIAGAVAALGFVGVAAGLELGR